MLSWRRPRRNASRRSEWASKPCSGRSGCSHPCCLRSSDWRLPSRVLKKPQFQSEMMFLVQASRTHAVISADRSAAVAPAQDVTEQQINSEMQLLESEDVIGAVVDPQWTRVNKTPAQVQEHESKDRCLCEALED